MVIFSQGTVDGRGINQRGIIRVESDMCAFTATHIKIIFHPDATVFAPTRYTDRRVVLLTGVDTKRIEIVRRHPVKLRRRLVHDAGPGFATVKGHRRTTIIGIDHVLVVVRVDPVIVMVTMWRFHLFPGFAAIDRLHHRHVHNVNGIIIHRVGRDVNVVPGTRMQNAVAVDQGPAFTGIITAPQTTLFRLCLDDGVNPFRVAGRYVHTDLADHFRQATGEFIPAIAAINGLIDTAIGTTGFYKPGFAAMVPHRRIKDARIGRIQAEICGTGIGTDL